MHKTVEQVLASAVASGGTFTVGYPTGYSAGDFENARDHSFTAMGATFRSPNDFTVSFGATEATITYNGTTTIPAQTRIFTQLNMIGAPGANQRTQGEVHSLGDTVGAPRGIKVLNKSAVGDLIFINLGSPKTADADGICASQSGTADTNLTINGADASTDANGNSVVVYATPRNVVAAWTGAAVLVVIGKDEYDQDIEERSASGTSFTGKKAFKKVTQAYFTANTTGATVGSGDALGLPVAIPSAALIVAEFEDGSPLKRLNEVERVSFVITEAEMDAATSVWVVPGFAGSVLSMTTAVGDTVTTGGALTVEIGGTAVDGLSVVIADASSAGDIDTDTATAGHATAVFTATQALEIVGDAAFNASGRINGFVECRRTNPLNGTLVAALSSATKSTATTGDVRGTYDPSSACNGAISFGLIALVPDASDLGNSQYSA